jgi:TP901 family phage tail tape measure protein
MTSETIEELVIKIKADVEQAQRDLKEVESSMDGLEKNTKTTSTSVNKSTTSMSKTFDKLGTAAVAAATAAIAALGALAVKSIQVSADFEQAITNAATVTGLAGQEFENAKKDMEELSITLGSQTAFTAIEVSNAMYDLASAGYDVANMTKSELKPILDIAAATQTDLTSATEITTSALGQFGLGLEESERVADTMAATIGNSKATLEKLSISLRQVGPVAHSMGMEIEDVNALLGQLYNAGLTGELAGTGLKTALVSLVDPSSEAQQAIESMGLTLEDVDPTTKDFVSILEDLRRAGITNQQTMQIFGREGAASISALLNNTEGVAELEATIRSMGGAAEDMAEKQLDTMNGQMKILRGNLQNVMTEAGDDAMESLTDTIHDFNEWGESGGYDRMSEGLEDIASALASVAKFGASAVETLTDLYSIAKVWDEGPELPEGVGYDIGEYPHSGSITVGPDETPEELLFFLKSKTPEEINEIREQVQSLTKDTDDAGNAANDTADDYENMAETIKEATSEIPRWAGHGEYIRQQLQETGARNLSELLDTESPASTTAEQVVRSAVASTPPTIEETIQSAAVETTPSISATNTISTNLLNVNQTGFNNMSQKLDRVVDAIGNISINVVTGSSRTGTSASDVIANQKETSLGGKKAKLRY